MPTRRDFFKQAASLSGSARLADILLASIQKASAIDPPHGSTFLDAEHIVILMQENRSFDHTFGALRGVRGFNDPRAVTLPDQRPVWIQTNAAGDSYAPFHLDLKESKATWLGSLPHSWRDQTDARNHGNHDHWLDSKPSGHHECAGMPLTLGYYNRQDLPFYYAFADAFTICDQHFCSSLTGTTPNRLYLWTGTVREKQDELSLPCVRNSEVDDDSIARWKTFPERLEEAGVSWKIYQNEINLPSGLNGTEDSWLANFSDNPIEWFEQYHAGFSANRRQYLEKLAGTLPAGIEQLRREIAAAGEPNPAKNKELSSKEAVLAKVMAERARFTDEAFQKLSPLERNLHTKAFTTNAGDPYYRQLAALKYRDGGEPREMAIPRGDVLHQFREDVRNRQLPTVSWLVAPEKFSDHPSAPWYGAWYVAEALDILTRNPEVWRKTIFILTYDENDGYFDHVPPFVAPDPRNPETGKTSPGINARVDYLRLELDRTRAPETDARGGPVGLGYRVPLLVASPWSRGGYVCSQVFDHTSVLQFLERLLSHRTRRQIVETNISPWRRTVCGDLTSVFRPFTGESAAALPFPPKDSFLEGVYNSRFKPLPSGYRKLPAAGINQHELDQTGLAWMPHQEPGVRPSAPLPYQLYAEGGLSPDGKSFEIALEARNEIFGKASCGSPFHVYTPGMFYGGTSRRTRAYAVAAGDRLTDTWDIAGFLDRLYHLRVCGPNGFFREFAGGTGDPALAIECEYRRAPTGKALTGDLEVRIASHLHDRPCTLHITDNAYKTADRTVSLQPGEKQSLVFSLSESFHWYDFTVRAAGAGSFFRRFAGRVETGQQGYSDPAMARAT